MIAFEPIVIGHIIRGRITNLRVKVEVEIVSLTVALERRTPMPRQERQLEV